MFFRNILHKVGSLKDWRNRSVWSKTTLISGGVGGAGVDPPSWKTNVFFVGPWHFVRQFIEISNQMELNYEVSNFEEKKRLYNRVLYIFLFKVWVYCCAYLLMCCGTLRKRRLRFGTFGGHWRFHWCTWRTMVIHTMSVSHGNNLIVPRRLWGTIHKLRCQKCCQLSIRVAFYIKVFWRLW